jgi:hypothetical protein
VSAINFANAGLFSVNAGASVANATIRVAYATDGTMTADEIADFNSLVNDHLITPRSSSSCRTTIPRADARDRRVDRGRTPSPLS